MGSRTHCKLCRYDKEVDYKDAGFLEKYIDRRGKLLPRSFTGNCAHHQREVSRAVKRARTLALLPFVR